MSERTYRKDDIVTWFYTDKHVDSLAYKSDLYWCKSRIAIFDGQKFFDTYWYSSDNYTFTVDQIGDKIDVKYIANLDDLDKQGDYKKASDLRQYYDSYDIVDLNHANNSRGNLYLRKGAKRSLEVVKKNLSEKIKDDESSIKYRLQILEENKQKLINLTQETITDLYF